VTRRVTRRRTVLFVLLCAVSIAVATVSVVAAARRSDRIRNRPVAAGTPSRTAAASYVDGPRLLFRSESDDMSYGKLALVPLDDLGAAPLVGSSECERVDFIEGRGLCLESDFGLFQPYHAVLLKDDLTEVWRRPLQGLPSRVRIAPDGKHAAITVFVTGHSYAEAGFSTLTTIVDLRTGETLTDLEQFTVSKDGAPFHSVDFNFWGVTFMANGRGFYATLGTGGHTYLVEGEIEARTARVLRDEVECPSLSPDGTRVAFKKRVSGSGLVRWRLHVLDLATMQEHALSETRSVDDQVEWLDDERILYSVPGDDPGAEDTWVVAADGTGEAELFRRATRSPAVVPAANRSG
jgi:dipeptidyl aminopeptidase/acylaminoacyl peptidase